jgi:DNA-binding XRE family transcriptional regulator
MLAVQCKMARAALGLGVRELADLAKVPPDTIVRFERGKELRERTVAAVRIALESAGIQFVPENGGGAGCRLAVNCKNAPVSFRLGINCEDLGGRILKINCI